MRNWFLKVSENFYQTDLKLIFFPSLDSVCKNLTFCVAYIFRFSFSKVKSSTAQEENQNKTGHADIKENNTVVYVYLQKFFSKNENLM